jgi:predicted nucleic acid-binding protein
MRRWRPRKSNRSENRLIEALARVESLNLQYHAVDHRAVVRLAIATRLSAYDSTYLCLARELDAPLVGLDRRLAAAARDPS